MWVSEWRDRKAKVGVGAVEGPVTECRLTDWLSLSLSLFLPLFSNLSYNDSYPCSFTLTHFSFSAGCQLWEKNYLGIIKEVLTRISELVDFNRTIVHQITPSLTPLPHSPALLFFPSFRHLSLCASFLFDIIPSLFLTWMKKNQEEGEEGVGREWLCGWKEWRKLLQVDDLSNIETRRKEKEKKGENVSSSEYSWLWTHVGEFNIL